MGKFEHLSPVTLLTPIQDSTLAQFAGYTEEEIAPVFDLMIDYLQAPVAHEALFKKYASKKFLKGKRLCLRCDLY